MPKKNTSKYDYDFAKNRFAEKGYELLETEHKNTHTKMKYRCPNHPDKELYSTLDNLMQGHGCIYCAKRAAYNYEEVKQIFNSKGYELLESEYKNTHTKMLYRCPNHPNKEIKTSVSNLLNGHGCRYCVSKYSYEEVKKVFDERGYELLEKEFINSYTPLKYRCIKHPSEEQKISFILLLRDAGCQYCSGNKTHTYEDVKNIFNSRGYELLEKEYKNNHVRIKYVCSYHPNDIQNISLHNLLQGSGCKKCGKENMAITRRRSIEEVKKEFTKRGYELLENGYINGKTFMRYQCPRHPEKDTKISYDSLILGNGCPYCSGNAKYTIEEAKQIFLKYGFELLENKYVNNKVKMKYRCKKHPEHIQRKCLSDLLSGFLCPYCSSHLESKLSTKIEEWLFGSGMFYKKEYKFDGCKFRDNLRFDFYLPIYKICIEADGKQHFEPATFGGISKERAIKNFELTKKKDKIKDDYCKKKGIKLIRVPYLEIENVEEILNKAFLKRSKQSAFLMPNFKEANDYGQDQKSVQF